MSIATYVEDLAKAAALTDPTDLPGLLALQEIFVALVAELDGPDLKDLGDLSETAARLLEQIVLHEINDVESTFAQINATIEYAQDVASALDGGRPVNEIAPPTVVDADGGHDVDEELLAEWTAACKDSLAGLEDHVVQIDSAADPAELIAEVRRGVHTIKGECGVLSLGVAQAICHEAESLIERTVTDGSPFPVDAVLAVVDWMRRYVGDLEADPRAQAPEHDGLLEQLVEESGGPDSGEPDATVTAASEDAAAGSSGEPVEFPPDLDLDENLNDFLGETREHIAAAEEALLNLERDFTDGELINTVFRAFHTIKGVAGFMHLEPIVKLAHTTEFLLDEARQGSLALDSSHLDLILRSCDLIASLIGVLEGADAPTQGTLTDLIGLLELASKGELAGVAPSPPPEQTTRATSQASPAAPEPDATPKSAPPKAAAPARSAAARKRGDMTVKVSTVRLDNLVTMVGELVIAQQMVVQDENLQQIAHQRFQRNVGHAGKIIRDLQEVAMSLRMVTVKGIFQRMARLVRDVSTKAGKQVHFHMEGEDTELDRNVVEEIGDPLVHMVRNSCDHGIESADERRRVGKPEAGNLTLRAYHQGGSIMIEIEDDGRGLNRDKILAKAIERGIHSPERDGAELSDHEAYGLIMLPGFSTAEKVTDISGRGVGLDVVRRNIEALRGKVEIHSSPGKGSTFRMALPLTMAIIDGMIVRVGSQRYVIPTLSIEQSYRPTADKVYSVVGRGEMASVRGALLPIYRLNRIFGLDEGIEDVGASLLIVLESRDGRCCLLVDEILGQQQVVIKSLGQGTGILRGVSGGAILGDGRVALIIDVGGLVGEATKLAA